MVGRSARGLTSDCAVLDKKGDGRVGGSGRGRAPPAQTDARSNTNQERALINFYECCATLAAGLST